MAPSIALARPQPATPAKPSLLSRLRRALSAPISGPPKLRTLPESPFASWDFDDAVAALDAALAAQTIDTTANPTNAIQSAPGEMRYPNPRARQNPIEVNRRFFQGDHWQDGAGYIGPRPQPQEAGATDTMNEIALLFTSQNAIREVTLRHALGAVGKAWQWGYSPRRAVAEDEEPTPDEQMRVDEASRLMTDWLAARKVRTLLQDAVTTLLLAERSAIQLTVPAGLAEEVNGTTVVRANSIEEALAKIWPAHPMPEDATVVTDPDTKLEAAVWTFEAPKGDGAADGAADNDEEAETVEYAGICYLDRDGTTVMRIVRNDADDDAADAADANKQPQTSPLPLGGRITMFEMHRPALITTQVQQAQRALNFALTMVPRNVTTGGFLERFVLDGMMPGHWEVDAEGRKTGKWIENPFYVGAGTTNFIQAAESETTDSQGNTVTTRGNPSVVFRDPIPPDASLAAKDAHYQSILEETGQLHRILSGTAQASGKSRIQARAEYLSTLQTTQPEAESALRFILDTALAMAEAIAGTPGYYTDLIRADASCVLDAGPMSPEERTGIEASVGKTLSTETAMAMLGVDDVDAEKARMMADPQARASLGLSIGNALVALTTAGASIEGAAKFLGIEPQQLDELLTAEPPPAVVPALAAGGNPGDPAAQSNPNPPPTNGQQPGDNQPTRSTSSSGSAAGGQ
jgi:hypothetical protein